MRRARYYFSTLAILALGATAHAADRYVSLSGNDANAGTLAAPLRTITQAAALAQPGDTIHVRAGVYNERVKIYSKGTAAARITFKPYNNEKVTLDGATVPADKAIVTLNETQYVDFSGFEVRNGPYIGILGWLAKNTRILNNDVHGTVRGGIWVGAETVGYSSDITVSGNSVHNTVLENQYHNMGGGGWAGAVVVSVTERATITDNRIWNNDGEGLISLRSNHHVVRGNTIWDNFSVELYIDNSRFATVDRNLVYNTGNPRYLRNGNRAAGIAVANETNANMNPSSDNVFSNNIVVGTRWGFYYGAWESGGGLRNTKVVNNTFYGTTDAIVEIENDAHANSVVQNNIFFGTGSPSPRYTGAGTGVTYAHNLWYGGTAGSAASSSDVLANPMFANPGGTAAADYKIRAGSAAVAKALNLTGIVANDHFGALRATPFDIGAHQLGSSVAADTVAPSIPVNLRATGGHATSVSIAWNPSTDNVGVTGYIVVRNGVQIATVAATTFTDNTSSEGKMYAYQVIATDAAGNRSAPSVALPLAWSSADAEAPSAPAARVATVTSTSVEMRWSPATDNVGVAEYRIYRGSTLVGNTDKRRFLDRGLKPKTTYTYSVVAVDTAGNATISDTLTVTTKAATKARAARR
ncbi:MAG TPA: right-handed parallel beta-helix repeat-containing protein [Thermoanaerobaculia bacterium]